MNFYKRIVSMFSVVLITLFLTLYLSLNNLLINTVMSNIDSHLANISSIVAKDEVVQQLLFDENMELNEYINDKYSELDNIEFITVTDMNSIRYSHPNENKLGEKFAGEDQYEALEGKSYISVATGTLGKSRRSFTPIYYKGKQIGMVSVGNLVDNIEKIYHNASLFLVSTMATVTIVAIIAVYFIINQFRKLFNDTTPEELKRQNAENETMLNSIHEGIITINTKNEITNINVTAKKLFNIDDSCIGEDVLKHIPTSKLPNVLITGEEIKYNFEKIENNALLISRFLIYDEDSNQVIGALAKFTNSLGINKLLDEIAGYREISNILRVKHHEFRNKLHVLNGLIANDQIEHAKSYLAEISETEVSNYGLIKKHVEDRTVVAIVMAKLAQADELGINLTFTEDSLLYENHKNITSDSLIVIIGNLVDNALNACHNSQKQGTRSIELMINETNDDIHLRVTDDADGIKELDHDSIYQRGITSSSDASRGFGLYIVKSIVDEYQGNIFAASSYQGTTFDILIPKEEK